MGTLDRWRSARQLRETKRIRKATEAQAKGATADQIIEGESRGYERRSREGSQAGHLTAQSAAS
jgi:hypothetical protein